MYLCSLGDVKIKDRGGILGNEHNQIPDKCQTERANKAKGNRAAFPGPVGSSHFSFVALGFSNERQTPVSTATRAPKKSIQHTV